ncbi:arylamine N-acetyltransferase, pineal gland isozyme NAT-10 [Achaetomium macrosporum]|uniref:Arylamine N-acetyltransferase, pineal gland isozyme NAT-10 n=1 Tax=Achaetomium macrosporum TaxID=79813 RepID=A0AAN7C9A3_9PEZI|nr:arylamine N-acetyltransferase, pineal gland isozyme NAT-10 [Achaetomium macrosporum]
MDSDSAYSPAQVAEYLEYIGLPQTFHPSSKPTLDRDYLTTLFTHQITAIPYENLSIHYSAQHAVDLDPQAIFAKIVTARRGRGGYCMENSILFNHMLRALGFADAYLAGVRIRPRVDGVPQGESYTGWVHLVNIVAVPDPGAGAGAGASVTKYVIDVGFGGDAMTRPMPLVEGLVHHNSIGTQQIRLVREFIPNQRFRDEGAGAQMMWIYQVRNGAEREWVSFFAFHDQFEFTEQDFGVVNWYTSQSPESFQTFTPLAIRFARGAGEDGRPKVVGKLMLVKGVVKRNFTGKTEVVKVCVTERERVEMLREHFGIQLTEEEAESIRGRQVELRGEAA